MNNPEENNLNYIQTDEEKINSEIFPHTIAVTNRKILKNPNDLILQVKRIISLHPKALILREKDLSDKEYLQLAQTIESICHAENVTFFIHDHINLAKRFEFENIHLPSSFLYDKDFDLKVLKKFKKISISCHSLNDIKIAENLGATSVTLGNIFETDCKKDLPGKGLKFLENATSIISIPIYAIGGINPANLKSILLSGASGGCMMSWFMKY